MTSYKLSSNENPYPPLPGVVEAAHRAVDVMNRYPDMGNSALYDALAARLRCRSGDLAAATGSVALIYQLLTAFCEPGDEVVHAWRSFEAYPIAIAAAAATSVPVPVTADGRHDLEAMAAAIGPPTRCVMVCTPNNPTGPAVTQTELDAFIAAVPEDVLVVVDEAYLEFVRMDDQVDGLATYRDHPNVVLSRTFSKAYGLAGFRVGYAVAQAPSPRRCARCRCRSASRASRRPRRSPRSTPRRSCWSGSTRWSRSGPACGRGCSRPAGRSRRRRATSSGSSWATGPPTSRPPPTSSASWSARSPARARGSPSARTEANDRLLALARAFPH